MIAKPYKRIPKRTIMRLGALMLAVLVVALVLLLGHAYASQISSYLWTTRLAAAFGSAPAQFKLGLRYDLGLDVPKDETEAAAWFRKAAEKGLATAQFKLGTMYELGQGVPKNEVQAITWFHKAAEQDDDRAQTRLGLRYAYGRGVPKDAAQAVRWWTKAAVQGNTTAQYLLGVSYFTGRGVARNHQIGCDMLRESSQQGYAPAATAYNRYCQ